MKFVSFAKHLHDLNFFKDQNFDEVILEHKDLSRFGTLKTDDLVSLSTRAREFNLKVLLDWDILMTESDFSSKKDQVLSLLPHVDALRVQDPGALEWAMKETTLPLHYIAENGYHNFEAIKNVISLSNQRIQRIILSIELPKETLKDYLSLNKRSSLENSQIQFELLGFGRVLLFYSPRSLLTPLLSDEEYSLNDSFLMATGASEESPHKGFPIVENRHGTFMFHIKEFSLIEYSHELEEMGLDIFRIDNRWHSKSYLKEILSLCQKKLANDHHFDQDFFHFKKEYPQDMMRGFYLVNKTDILFSKLKNSRLQERENNYIGEVLEVVKGSHIAIHMKNQKSLSKGDHLKIQHPKGDLLQMKVFSLRDLSLKDVNRIGPGEVALVQYMRGVWVKSLVFHDGHE